MEHVFICYSRKDQNVALQLKEILANAGKNVWIDVKDLPASSIWRSEIQYAIRESIAFVYLVSSNSLESEYCQKEFEFACELNKRIFPILLPEISDKDIPEIVSLRQWLTWGGHENNTLDINKLIRDIETDYEWVKFITELGVNEARWKKQPDNSRLLSGKKLQEAEQQLVNAGSKKNPQPTDIQREFVKVSRKVEQSRKKTITGIAIGVSIILCLLCMIAVTGGTVAYFQSNAKATAQIQAGEQGNIALARQLAAQSQLISLNASNDTVLSGLLAIESLKRYPSLEGDLAIKRVLNILGRPTASLELSKEITCMAFSKDKKLLVTGNSEGLVQVWDIANRQEIAQILHESKITNVAFSTDMKSIISSDLDDIVYVWDIESTEAVNIIHLDGSLSRFIASPDGKSIANMILLDTGKWVISIQDISNSFEEFRIPTDTDNPITPLAFNSSGDLLAIYDVNKNNEAIVFIWDVNLKKEIAKFVSNTSGNWVNTVEFSNNGFWVASGDREGNIHVWDVNTGNEIFHANIGLPVSTIIFSPDDKFLAAANYCWKIEVCNTSISVWDINTGQETVSMQEPGGINGLDISLDGKYLASAGGDGTARVWDLIKKQEIGRMLHGGEVKDIVFALDDKSITSVDINGEIIIWNMETGQAGEYELQENGIRAASLTSNGDKLITINFDNIVRVRDARTGEEIYNLKLEAESSRISFSPDGNLIPLSNEIVEKMDGGYATVFLDDNLMAFATTDGNFRVLEYPSGNEKLQVKFGEGVFPNVLREIVPNPKEELVALGFGYYIKILNTVTGQEVCQLSSENVVTDLTFSSNGELIASGELYIGSNPCPKCFARVWDVKSCKEIASFAHNGRVVSVDFSPNGKWLLTASQDGTARIWDISIGQEVSRMTYDRLKDYNSVESIAFNSDGSLVISGSLNGDVRVWEPATGHEIARTLLEIDQPSQGLVYVGFNGDGKTALAVSGSGTIRSWIWKSQNLTEELCSRLTRNMSLDEWNYYFGDEPYQATCSELPIPTENQ